MQKALRVEDVDDHDEDSILAGQSRQLCLIHPRVGTTDQTV